MPGADARDRGYWREVGTIDSYFEAHMDLCAVHPVFNLYNNRWPILTHVPAEPPAKFVHEDGDRAGRAFNSVISNGVIVSGGLVRESVLSPGVRVDSWARVERSVILHNTRIGRRAVVRERHPGQERGRRWRAPRSGWTTSTTGPAGSWCPPAASPWSARDRWWHPNRWSGTPRGGGGR